MVFKIIDKKSYVIGGLCLEFQLHLLVVVSQLANLPKFYFINGKMISTPTFGLAIRSKSDAIYKI